MTAPAAAMTWEEALLAAAAAQAAASNGETVVSTVATIAEAVIRARETAANVVLTMLRPLWAELDVYNGRAVQAFTETAAGYMRTAQTVTAQAAAAAQQHQLSAMGVQVSAAPSDPLNVRGQIGFDGSGTLTLQRGTAKVDYADRDRAVVIDLDEDATTVGIFNRPARAQRYLESEGMDRRAASQRAEERIETLVDDNLMLAQRLAEAEIIAAAVDLDSSPVVGTRRVIHPELSRTGVCGLCIAASDRVYTVRALRPIHDRCKCTTAAVTLDHDPADDLNAVDLSLLYGDGGGTSGAQLKRTRYKIDEHGELGAVLVPAKAYKPRGNSKTPGIAPTAPESPAEVARRHLPILSENLKQLRAQGFGENSAPVIYHREQIERFRRALA